jgi:hypothetical protein
MKRIGMLLGLVLAVTGLARASINDEAPYGDQAVNTDEGNEYMVACTNAGMADGLSGDDLDAYVQDCMDNPDAVHKESTGEDS